MVETLKEKTAKGLFWGGLSNGVQQVLNLVFGIFLARMLTQSDYGMVGMLTVFSALAGALQGGGFISALNRKKEVSHRDYNAVFWTNVLVSFWLYVILFLCAPLIAQFYDIPELTSLARFIFIGLFISSFGIAPSAIMYRNMMVRQQAICSFVSLTISGVIAVILAYYGFSYWGIAIQTVVYIILVQMTKFYFTGWRPTLPVDFSPIKEMIGFSSKLIITDLFNIVSSNIFPIILGKLYTPREVGNYTQANKWNNMGSTLVGSMVGGISQPVFAKTDNDVVRQKRVFRKLLRFTAFVSFPAMFGLALVSKEFIVILLTEKWLESALMMQMLCIAGAFAPISALFSNLIITRGHSTTYLWCSISLCLVQLLVVCLSTSFGIERMIQVYVIVNICWLFIWRYFASKEIQIGLYEVIKDIIPYLVIMICIFCVAIQIFSRISNLYTIFICKVVFVVVIYCVVLWLLKSVVFRETVFFLIKKTKKVFIR